MKYTADTKMSEIIKLEKGAEILAKFGVPCTTCPHFAMEMEKLTIGEVCNTYGIDLKKLLEELNK